MRAKRPDAVTVFAALGDETRMRLVTRLANGEPLSITRLSAGSRVTRQAVTRHLHVLARAGVVSHARRGRERLWELRPAALLDARRLLERIASEWEGALGRLKAALENEDRVRGRSPAASPPAGANSAETAARKPTRSRRTGSG